VTLALSFVVCFFSLSLLFDFRRRPFFALRPGATPHGPLGDLPFFFWGSFIVFSPFLFEGWASLFLVYSYLGHRLIILTPSRIGCLFTYLRTVGSCSPFFSLCRRPVLSGNAPQTSPPPRLAALISAPSCGKFIFPFFEREPSFQFPWVPSASALEFPFLPPPPATGFPFFDLYQPTFFLVPMCSAVHFFCFSDYANVW